MTAKLTLYTRTDCCLCDEMKAVVRQIAETVPIELVEIDVDGSADLQEKFGNQVPVLFINGRKAFKYRVTAAELISSLNQQRRPFLRQLFGATRKEQQ